MSIFGIRMIENVAIIKISIVVEKNRGGKRSV